MDLSKAACSGSRLRYLLKTSLRPAGVSDISKIKYGNSKLKCFKQETFDLQYLFAIVNSDYRKYE